MVLYMPKNTPSIEEQAENVQLNTFEEDIADAGAESPDEGHDTTKLALKPKKSRKNRSPAQVAAFEKMRAAKQQKDEAKRAAKKEDDALTEFVDSGDDDYEQIQSQRKKARAKAKKPKRKPKAPVYAYSSSDSSDEQEEVLAVVKRRRPKKKAVRIIYEDELLGDSDEEQQQAHVDIPQQPQVMIL